MKSEGEEVPPARQGKGAGFGFHPEPGESRGCWAEGEAAALPAAAWEHRATEHKINTLAHQEMLMRARRGIASYGQAICAERISVIKTWCKAGRVFSRICPLPSRNLGFRAENTKPWARC